MTYDHISPNNSEVTALQNISSISEEEYSDQVESSSIQEKKRKHAGGKKMIKYGMMLLKLLENRTEIISNNNVFDLLQNEEFFSKCCQIASILKLVKELTNILEARNASLAECFIDSEIDDNDNDNHSLTDNLNLSQLVDLTLPEFLSTNNALFESAINRLSSYERAYNLENRDYDPIRLAQQIMNEESNNL
ncbi:2986_t:CDS:2 [Racocetra fulgida]|uniref:2986_t:CDS:1 n=1 Tax=Racocetra fulgida TaxID=60492 RepID=A0A9N9EYG0_9GLOM|nr:2986_t:CDS:2 [Racocetra fulgida]